MGEARNGEVGQKTRNDNTEHNSTLAEAEKPNERTNDKQRRDVRMMMAAEGKGKDGKGRTWSNGMATQTLHAGKAPEVLSFRVGLYLLIDIALAMSTSRLLRLAHH